MKSVELKEFIALPMLFTSFIKVVRADNFFWQRRNKLEKVFKNIPSKIVEDSL